MHALNIIWGEMRRREKYINNNVKSNIGLQFTKLYSLGLIYSKSTILNVFHRVKKRGSLGQPLEAVV